MRTGRAPPRIVFLFALLLALTRVAAMTERERWVVYPLLFLALGASLRDKFSSRTTSKIIECEELRVVEEDPTGREPTRILAKIGRTDPTASERSSGLLAVDGDANIGGQLVVQGVQVVPSLQNMVQGLQLLLGGLRQRTGPAQVRPLQPPANRDK